MWCLNDDALGPGVQGCRGDFDFTLRFEYIFFSIVPSCVFLVLASGRFLWLFQSSRLAETGPLLWAKITTIVVLAALELSHLIIAAQHTSDLGRLSLPSNILQCLVALSLLSLSFLEHQRALRPSLLLACFLSVTLLFDIARTRTLWLLYQADQLAPALAELAVAASIVKGVLLILEGQTKPLPRDWKDCHSPEESKSIYSLSTYSWVLRLLLTGFRNVLSTHDLYPLDQTMSASKLKNKSSRDGNGGQGVCTSQSLSRRMFTTTLATPVLAPIIPRLAVIGFTFCQPLLMQAILNYLQSPDVAAHGYGLIGATALIYTGLAISNALYYYWQERYVCMARGVIFTALYEKTVMLPTASVADSAAITLMNTDVERVKTGLLPIHEYWANPVEVAIACWLLERQIGAAFAAPIVVIIFCIVGSAAVASVTGRRQLVWMKAIEERVAATAATISAIKSLHVSGLTSAVQKLIQSLREQEIRVGGKWRLMLVIAVTLAFTPMLIGPLMAFAVTSRTLEVARIFPAVAYILLLAVPLVSLFQNIPSLMSAIACLRRIDAFMDKENRFDPRITTRHPSGTQEKASDANAMPAIEVKEASFGWTDGDGVLNRVNLVIPFSTLTLLVGPTASGKSTFLKVLLGEMPVSAGTITFATSFPKIAYCDQTPFLLDDTIRANIIGQAEFDVTRYQEALHATSLSADLKRLQHGDRTKIGGSGVSLSGGQKQRLALARALYAETYLYLLDDVFSGLDRTTSSLVFQRTLGPKGLLTRRNATVVLCTQDEQHVPFADNVVTIDKAGVFTAQSNTRRAETCKVGGCGTEPPEYEEPSGQDKEMVQGESSEEEEQSMRAADSAVASQKDDGARRVGDFSVYRHYFSNMETWVILLFIVSCCCFGFASNFPTVWLTYWSADVAREEPTHSGAFYVGIYGLLQTSALLSLIAVVLLCTQSMIAQTGSRLHKNALQTVLRSPLRFFGQVDTGTVTNLFAQDLTLIDSELPLSLLNFALSLFSLVGMAAVLSVASPWLALAYPILIVALYYVQLFYLRTSRQLRLLDLESRAPLYAHFIETITGLVTLRALGHLEGSVSTSDCLLDTSQRPTYMLAMIQRWLQFLLRIIVMLLAVIIVALATQLRTDTGFTGATLLTLMNFGDMLATLVQSYTALETSIGAVARLKAFSLSIFEAQHDEDAVPDKAWPNKGQIEICGVSASYSGNEPSSPGALVLRDVSVTFDAGERVGIVGRTGSGKSSVVLLLLRLLDPVTVNETLGSIRIDGISIGHLSQGALRQRIIAVAQDPVFMPTWSNSSLRSELDPYQEATDDVIIDVLTLHGLGFLLASSEDRAGHEQSGTGLDCSFSPSTLSQGQKQLLNLARSVVRRRIRAQNGINGGILLLDEASSSVDAHTNEKMWSIMQNEFAAYTIVMVVHRLDLAMKCDRVVVMDDGRVVESGQPDELRAQEDGPFKALLETWQTETPDKG